MNDTTRRNQPAVHWLISREADPATSDDEVYLVNVYGSDGALAVFSFEEEAQMFAGAIKADRGWEAMRVEDKKLLEVLYRIRSTIGFVALDPLPENIAPEAVNLVCVGQEYFTHYLLRRIQRRRGTLPDVYRGSGVGIPADPLP